MFSSKKCFHNLKDIPSQWIFKYYLGLSDDAFTRQIKIKSIFNPNDKTPSMYVYFDRNFQDWCFKCHSTGRFGNAVNLVRAIYNLSTADATEKILDDYQNYGNVFVNTDEFCTVTTRASVENYAIRQWTKADANYWLQFNIGSSMLERYNVFPLSTYDVVHKDINTKEVIKSYTFNNNVLSYGYFSNDKELYKIYNPKNKSKKFICIDNVIQGAEQLEFHDTIVITSSLKDIMAIKSLGFRVDCIAPSSESVKIKPEIINEWLKKEYKHVVVYMDSDIAGINAMKFYEEHYNLPFVYLPREKDISDIIKIHGRKTALYDLYPKLQNAIEKYIQKNS